MERTPKTGFYQVLSRNFPIPKREEIEGLCSGNFPVDTQPNIEKVPQIPRDKKPCVLGFDSARRNVNVARRSNTPSHYPRKSRRIHSSSTKPWSTSTEFCHGLSKVSKVLLRQTHALERLESTSEQRCQGLLGFEETIRLTTGKHLDTFLEQEKCHVISQATFNFRERKRISYLKREEFND